MFPTQYVTEWRSYNRGWPSRVVLHRRMETKKKRKKKNEKAKRTLVEYITYPSSTLKGSCFKGLLGDFSPLMETRINLERKCLKGMEDEPSKLPSACQEIHSHLNELKVGTYLERYAPKGRLHCQKNLSLQGPRQAQGKRKKARILRGNFTKNRAANAGAGAGAVREEKVASYMHLLHCAVAMLAVPVLGTTYVTYLIYDGTMWKVR
ncbi:unnamed protein product [Fusarium graminearum]|uniref:Uncharacterized protein n=1 Tax=Gibberella zeae TaxID=5518 RepID=A0A4E9DSM6_GIBZA|nr:unnamed protein product [Fusarium graminearum]CAF3636494.1 unnamed protein product [Fusarium graminearum]CAG1974070.1 unnamed protein product [Fusarium graminearum]CAG1976986.1 unnamed protein product [Fusarium graminearum]